jgi:signal peptidase II
VSSSAARAWARMLIVSGLVVIADQAVKGAIVQSMAPGERTDLALGFDLARVSNSGIAFGLLDGGDDGLVFAITAAALVLVLGWFALDPNRPALWLGVGLLTGGAFGNLADRVRDGAVTDFLDPPLWPAFNVADIAITAGVVVIALAALAAPAEPEAAEP